MSKTQAALQRRLGRLSMLIDICEQQLSPRDDELITSMKKELSLIKELSLRLIEAPDMFEPRSRSNGERPAVTSRRP